ncbi:MAG: SBBP repeat-containing protein [Bacteroidota bacterium]
MKNIYWVILLNTCLFVDLKSQTFDWAKREGLWAYDYGYGIDTDPYGNIYVAGKYEQAANFSGQILPDKGNHDIYLAQYSSTGTLNWIKTAGGASGDYAEAIDCDGTFIYIAGEIEGYPPATVTFDGSPNITVDCMGNNDVFLAKYDLSGNLLWVVSEGGFQSEKALGVAADNFGNVYICGYFKGTADFGGTTITESGNRDIFIAKYGVNGTFQWVRQAGSSQRDEAKTIKCDAAGNVYIAGMHSDGAIFGTQTLNSPNGYYNSFISKYAPDGTLIWAKSAGGDYDEVTWGLTIDKDGKIYVTGEFNAYALFDAIPLTTTGEANIFVACYDESGNAQWATQAGGNWIDRARGIGTDGTNIYITGQFANTATFGSFTLVGVDSSEIFMAALNNTGAFLWATSVGGMPDSLETLSYESGNAITADVSGNVFATGALLDDGVFGSIPLTTYSRTDVFITKITQAVSVKENHRQQYVSLYPNPNNGNFILDLNQLPDQKVEVYISNCIGQIVDQKTYKAPALINVDMLDKQKGIYFVEIKNENKTIVRNKIVLQ